MRNKRKGARNEKSLAPIIKQNDERGKRMAKQKDGRYRAKITVGTDASGKSIVKYVSGRTKKELEAAKAAAREKYVTDAARTAGDLQHYSRHVPCFRKN